MKFPQSVKRKKSIEYVMTFISMFMTIRTCLLFESVFILSARSRCTKIPLFFFFLSGSGSCGDSFLGKESACHAAGTLRSGVLQ